MRRRRSAPAFRPVLPAGAPAPGAPPVSWGYARRSTDDQVTDAQRDALITAGIPAGRIIEEEISGAVPAARRPQLAGLLEILRPGDALAVARLDRLGRDPADTLTLLRDLGARGVRVRLLDLGADTSTPAGELVVGVLAVVAGWERAILRTRTREGLAAARLRGQPLGRRRTLTPHQRTHAAELAAGGLSVREVARRLGCAPSVAHRAIAEAQAPAP